MYTDKWNLILIINERQSLLCIKTKTNVTKYPPGGKIDQIELISDHITGKFYKREKMTRLK